MPMQLCTAAILLCLIRSASGQETQDETSLVQIRMNVSGGAERDRRHNCFTVDKPGYNPNSKTLCEAGLRKGAFKCEFPFKYRGDTYRACTRRDYDNRLWCQVADGGYGLCDESVPRCTGEVGISVIDSCVTLAPPSDYQWSVCDGGLNGEKVKCHLPFQYKGETYQKCTTVDSTVQGRSWCAVDSDWPKGGFGYCTQEQACQCPQPPDKCDV